MNEFELIKRIRKIAGKPDPRLAVGIGDDCAAFYPPEKELLLLTTDCLAEGVHFRRAFTTPREIGWKALAVNLSDIAAMGGSPGPFLLTLMIPRGEDERFITGVLGGVIDCARKHGASLAGGNISASPSGSLVIDIAATGTVKPGHEVKRSGAAAGDLVLLVGHTGLSAAGLEILERGKVSGGPGIRDCIRAHNRPAPMTRAGSMIGKTGIASSMIDISDGLLADIGHICEESGVGAEIDAGLVPIHRSLSSACRSLGLDPLIPALSGGEDYALAFCASPEKALAARAFSKTIDEAVTVIGRIGRAGGVRVINAPSGLSRMGFDHLG